MEVPAELLEVEPYCVVTTWGRAAGRRYTAELWCVPADGGVYLMSSSGGLTQWCMNLTAEGEGVVRIGERSWLARAAVLDPREPRRAQALDRFRDRYDPEGTDRTASWAHSATVIHMVFVREL